LIPAGLHQLILAHALFFKITPPICRIGTATKPQRRDF
jgi:hypothetical protein